MVSSMERLPLHSAARSIRPIALLLLLACGPALHAQISLASVVDLALKNSPKVKMAQADLDRSNAAFRQTKDAYLPNIAAGSGLGYTYGFPVGSPTLFSFTSQSLMFDVSQFSYLRATRAGIQASTFSLLDARQQVEEDAAASYIQLDNDLQQQKVIADEYGSAQKLGDIVQQRLDAGLDSKMDLTRAKLNGAQIHLKQLHLDGDIAGLREHLALLTGLPGDSIVTDPESIPGAPGATIFEATYMPPAVHAAYANAASKQAQAKGDRHQLYWPQIGFGAQYARFAGFNNYQDYYGSPTGTGGAKPFQFNNAQIGLQLVWPLFDHVRRDKADASAADAAHAQHEADMVRDLALEGQLKLRHAIDELTARQDVAVLDRELAEEQSEAVTIQLTAGTGNPGAPPITPKDEQNARIASGQKSLELLDADFQLRQAQLDLLRATGGIEAWIRSTMPAATPTIH